MKVTKILNGLLLNDIIIAVLSFVVIDEELVRSPTAVPVMGVAGEMSNASDGASVDQMSNADSEPALSPPVYFRSFTFSPDVLIRFDYQGKHVDLSQGTLAGILVGLGQLNCSQLTLKRLSHRHGLLGANKLVAYALNEWLVDIKKNQLPSVLGGVGPMHSIVQLGEIIIYVKSLNP